MSQDPCETVSVVVGFEVLLLITTVSRQCTAAVVKELRGILGVEGVRRIY